MQEKRQGSIKQPYGLLVKMLLIKLQLSVTIMLVPLQFKRKKKKEKIFNETKVCKTTTNITDSL